MSQIVTVKLQRPIVTNGSYTEVMSYTVDEDDDQISNPIIENMPQEDIDLLFGDYYKVYYLGKYRKGKPVSINPKKPIRKEEWV